MKDKLHILSELKSCFLFKFQIFVFILFCVLNVVGQEAKVDVRILSIGEKIEREVVQQDLHRYGIELKRGQLLKVNFLEKGTDISAFAWRYEDNRNVSVTTGSGKGFMRESLTILAEKDGIYFIDARVESVTDSKAKYELTASLSDSADSNDLLRIKAEKLIEQASLIINTGDIENLSQAITKLEESLKIWQGLGDTYWEAVAKMKIGEAFLGLKNTMKAESTFLEAINLFDNTQTQQAIGYIYFGLANVYFQKKDEEKVRTYTNQALEISRKLGDTRFEKTANIATLNNLAELGNETKPFKLSEYQKEIEAVKAKKNKADEASAWALFLLKFATEGDGEDVKMPPIKSIYNLDAWSQEVKKQQVEQNEKAKMFLKRAEAEGLLAARQTNDKNLEVQILVGLGLSYLDIEDVLEEPDVNSEEAESDLTENKVNPYAEKSKQFLMQGLALSKSINNQLFESFAYMGLFGYYSDNDETKLALFFAKRFINSVQNFRQNLKTAVDREIQQLFSNGLNEIYDQVATVFVEEHRLGEALQIINLGREQEFFDFKLIDNQPSAKITLTQREKDNEPIFDRILEKVIAKVSTNNYQNIMNFIGSDFETLENNFEEVSSEKDVVIEVEDLKNMKSFLSTLTQKTGRKHVTIYQFNEDDDEGGYINFLLITPQDIKAFSGDRNDKDIIKFLCLLQRPDLDPNIVSGKIYENIFQASEQIKESTDLTFEDEFKKPELLLEDELEKIGADVIHWSLSGKMRYIPMAALYDKSTNQYLTEKFENVVFTRAKKERFLSEQKVWKAGLGFATTSAITTTNPNLSFGELPNVDDEVFTIFGNSKKNQLGLFDGKIFLNKEFTSDSFMMIGQIKPDFVHIASHFNFSAGDARNSFLPLVDGKKISLFDLKNRINLFEGVDSLVLSACQTATQTSNSDGKEIDGLAELTQRLGAKSVIATLWSIEDTSASKLMSEFYQIKKDNPNISKGEVLRLAQLRLLNGNDSWVEGMKRRSVRKVETFGDSEDEPDGNNCEGSPPFKPSRESPFEHPYYWAGFVYYGSSNGEKTSEYILSKPQPIRSNNNVGSRNSTRGGITQIRPENLIGTWEGLFDQQQYSCVLEIEKVEGNTFYGILKPMNGQVEVKGFIDIETRQISFIETRVISLGDFQNWSLGNNRGTFSDDGNFIAGTGFGGTVSYNWSFRKKTFGNSINDFNAPTNIQVTLNDIETSFKNNLIDETIRLSRIFLQKSPESKEANGYLGLALLFRKDSANAVIYLEKAINLGQAIPIPMKRLREPILGHGLDNAFLVISKSEINIISDKSVFRANYNELTQFALFNYDNQCNTVHLKGTFTESKENSTKTKQDKKTFNLFPPSSFLQPRQQGNLVLNFAACTTEESHISVAIINLINRLASKPN